MSEYTNKLLVATREQLIEEILRLRGDLAAQEKERGRLSVEVESLTSLRDSWESTAYKVKADLDEKLDYADDVWHNAEQRLIAVQKERDDLSTALAAITKERDEAQRELSTLLDAVVAGPLEAGTASNTIVALRAWLDAALDGVAKACEIALDRHAAFYDDEWRDREARIAIIKRKGGIDA